MRDVLTTMELRTPTAPDDAYVATLRAAHGVGCAADRAALFAAAVGELADNAVRHGGGGRLELARVDAPTIGLEATVTDGGRGLPQTALGALEGGAGAGGGLALVHRAVDVLSVGSDRHQGTRIRALLRADTTEPSQLPSSDLALFRAHGRLLAETLLEARALREELGRAREELEETNKGVLALYAELEERALMLGRAAELKSIFISSISHEFRTPVSAILSLAELLLAGTDGELTAEQEKQVRLISRSTESLLALVNDLLDLARIESGKLEIRPKCFTLHETLTALRSIVRTTEKPQAPPLVLDLPGDLPQLETDEGKLSQILRNLLSNAYSFTSEGEIRARARTIPGDVIEIEVSDTGIGIPRDQQQRIFEEFVQVDSPAQRRRRGTGLGLPISRKLAEALGGELTVTSEPGRGSTFTLRLPRRYRGPLQVSVDSPAGGDRG